MISRSAASVALACLLATACSCSLSVGSGKHAVGASSSAQAVSTGETGMSAQGAANNLDFALINFTGTSLHAVYISSSDSTGWEENILAGVDLADGDRIDVRFNPAESAALWDIRVEGVDGRYAEWKSINLRDVSRITLRLKPAGEAVVVAEVE